MTTNPQTLCRTCMTPIGYIDAPTGGWWAHDQHPADEHDAVPGAWVDGDELMEAIAAEVWEHCATEGTASLVVDDPRNIAGTAVAVARRNLGCPDPIECSHEAALGEARQEVRRLGLMVDEYGTGASALTDKLKRVRDMHRETCILAQGQVQPTAFKCGMCEILDAPADGPSRVADVEQPEGEAVKPTSRTWTFEVCYEGDKWQRTSSTVPRTTSSGAGSA